MIRKYPFCYSHSNGVNGISPLMGIFVRYCAKKHRQKSKQFLMKVVPYGRGYFAELGNPYGSSLGWLHMAIFNPIRWTTLSIMRSGHVSCWFVRFSSLRLPGSESFTKLTVMRRFCKLQNRSLNSYSFVYVKLTAPRSQKDKRSYFRSCFMAYVKHLNCSASVSARPFPEFDFVHASSVTASLIGVRRTEMYFSLCM